MHVDLFVRCCFTDSGETSDLLDMRPEEDSTDPLYTNPLTTRGNLHHTMHHVFLPVQLTLLLCFLSHLPPSSLFSLCAVIDRSFVIQQIPSSNLFMVVVDNKCDCTMFEPITMDPIEIMYILHWPKTVGVAHGA